MPRTYITTYFSPKIRFKYFYHLSHIIKRIAIHILLFLLFIQCTHKQEHITIIQLNDPQIGSTKNKNDSIQFDKAIDAITLMNPDYTFICGDLVDSMTPNSLKTFRTILNKKPLHNFTVPGNHDFYNSITLDTFKKNIGADNFCFTNNNYVFIGLNTNLWKLRLIKESVEQDLWLSKVLMCSNHLNKSKIIIAHHPLFTDSIDEPENYFNLSPEVRMRLLELFNKAQVKLYLHGHTHRIIQHQLDHFIMSGGEATSFSISGDSLGFRVWTLSTDTITNYFVPIN